MSKYRRAAKVDDSQTQIVKELRAVPGISVELGHDDIIVGYRGKTYWYELKNKKPSASRLQKDQVRLINEYTGHYKIVWSADMILREIGAVKNGISNAE